MGIVKGDPLALVALFFGAAVVSMGGLYALVPAMIRGPSFIQVALAGALAASLAFSVLIIGRVFWLVAGSGRKARS